MWWWRVYLKFVDALLLLSFQLFDDLSGLGVGILIFGENLLGVQLRNPLQVFKPCLIITSLLVGPSIRFFYFGLGHFSLVASNGNYIHIVGRLG